jgi:predicted MFS family arabinose efflux permease
MTRRRERRGTTRLGRTATLLSLLAALSMVVGSGVQNWSTVFLADVVRANARLAALAPGVFAAAMVLGRLGGHWLSGRVSDRVVLLGTGVLSGSGVLLLAIAATPGYGLLGTATVGAAVAAIAPTAYARIGRAAPPGQRGNVLGSATSIANTGWLVGPALVGQMAGHSGLRSAVAALSVLSVAVCLLALRVPRSTDGVMT